MIVTINKSKANGKIQAPPSKSMAHRALICAALSENSKVSNLDFSNDISATFECLSLLGANVQKSENTVIIGGFNPFNAQSTTIDCGESGSTLRFLIPLCMLSNNKITLKGTNRLFERNLTIFEDIARENDVLFQKQENSLAVCGKIKSGNYKVAGNISSQFISGLLFALPLLEGDSTLEIIGEYESEPYVDLTIKSLADFGVNIEKCDRTYKIKGGQKYLAQDITVEGDYSNAAFLDGFNLIGGNVQVEGLDVLSLQGDKIYKQMYQELKNGQKEFDLSNCPDLAPVMFALSAVYGGARFTGTARLKIKESDRATAMQTELSKFGIRVDVGENDVTIYGGELKAPSETLCGHNDHRIVMALSLLCTIMGGSINDAQSVSKSYPDYFSKIESLGIQVTKQ